MKRAMILAVSLSLMFSLAACGTSGNDPQPEASPAPSSQVETQSGEQTDAPGTSVPAQAGSNELDNTDRQIRITTPENEEIVFQLNDSSGANDFYQQLPLSIVVEDYAGSEKIFYPPEELDVSDTPMAQGPAGTLAYYAPWGNVAIFYGECGEYEGLYQLGEAVSGVEYIAEMTGEIQIEAVRVPFSSPASIEVESTPQAQSTVEAPETQEPESEVSSEESETMQMNVQVGAATFSATLEENAATEAFVEMMKSAPVTIQMSDYSGFEKVGALGTSLPTSNSQTTTQSGDIVLYNGNQIVIFYGSNSWSYTRLGKIDDLTGWTQALGSGDVTVTFSVS